MPDRYELRHWEDYRFFSEDSIDLYLPYRASCVALYDGRITLVTGFGGGHGDPGARGMTLPAGEWEALIVEAIAVARHHWGDQWGRDAA